MYMYIKCSIAEFCVSPVEECEGNLWVSVRYEYIHLVTLRWLCCGCLLSGCAAVIKSSQHVATGRQVVKFGAPAVASK